MTRVGIIVEGPSDQAFWSKFLWRCLPGVHWDVRTLHGRTKLLRGAAALVETFRVAGAVAVVVLLDRDEDPCVSAIRELFPESLRDSFTNKPRNTHLLVAMKELESWFLADESAIRQVTGVSDYAAPAETALVGSKTKLKELLHSSPGRVFNEIGFAKQIAPSFSAERAVTRSESFAYCWDRLQEIAAQVRNTPS